MIQLLLIVNILGLVIGQQVESSQQSLSEIDGAQELPMSIGAPQAERTLPSFADGRQDEAVSRIEAGRSLTESAADAPPNSKQLYRESNVQRINAIQQSSRAYDNQGFPYAAQEDVSRYDDRQQKQDREEVDRPYPIFQTQDKLSTVGKPTRYIVIYQKHTTPGQPDLSTATFLTQDLQGTHRQIQEVDTPPAIKTTKGAPIVLPLPYDFHSPKSGSITSTFISKDVGPYKDAEDSTLPSEQQIPEYIPSQLTEDALSKSPQSTYGLPNF